MDCQQLSCYYHSVPIDVQQNSIRIDVPRREGLEKLDVELSISCDSLNVTSIRVACMRNVSD